MKNRLFLIAEREGYTPEQCGNTMTVGSTSLLAGILSILTSIATGLPEV